MTLMQHHYLVKSSLSQFKKLPCPKLDMPYLITYLCRTHVFEWHAVRCGFKHGYKVTHVFRPLFISRAFELTIINICFDQPLVCRKQLCIDEFMKLGQLVKILLFLDLDDEMDLNP